jgi:hypothetical protein
MYVQYIQDLCQSRLSTADHAPIICSLRYASSLDTAAKYSVLGFALPYIGDICIFMILYDCCLLPT